MPASPPSPRSLCPYHYLGNGSQQLEPPTVGTSLLRCLEAILAYPDRFEGLGFVFSKDDPLTGVDYFDNRLVGGEINPEI